MVNKSREYGTIFNVQMELQRFKPYKLSIVFLL
jgi:hypothetical protein